MTRNAIYLQHMLDALRRIRAYTRGGKADFLANRPDEIEVGIAQLIERDD